MSIRDELINRNKYRSDVDVDEVLRLESEVVEAALVWHEIVKWAKGRPLYEVTERGLECYEARRKLDEACDALLAVRVKGD